MARLDARDECASPSKNGSVLALIPSDQQGSEKSCNYGAPVKILHRVNEMERKQENWTLAQYDRNVFCVPRSHEV